MVNKLRYSAIICLGLFMGGLYLNSSVWFRLKLADFYKSSQNYKQAIRVYNKIIRRCFLKSSLGKEELAKVYFSLGLLYAELNFRNKAIESYVKAFSISEKTEFDKYYQFNDIKKDELLPIGLLESGRWNEASKEFIKLKESFPYHTIFLEAYNFRDVAEGLNDINLSSNQESFLFFIGDYYIKNNLFNEGREFFTKRILDYGIDPLRVLNYVNKKYFNNTEIKQKVWGSEFYVTLEDFEDIYTQLRKWIGTKEVEVFSHRISGEVSFKGYHSEFLDIDYTERTTLGDYDLWIKPIQIPLFNESLNLGVRFYIYSIKPVLGDIAIEFLFKKSKVTGIVGSSEDVKDVSDNWKEYNFKDVFSEAENLAFAKKWNVDEVIIDKIMFCTRCLSGMFFIDEIELYCANK